MISTIPDFTRDTTSARGVLIARIEAKLIDGGHPPNPFRELEETCLIWTGGFFNTGYPTLSVNNKTLLVHRWVYMVVNGIDEVPSELEVDHVCRRRDCLRPSHLELVTSLENQIRGREARTHCRNGHEFSPENTRMVKNKKGEYTRRLCVICRQSSNREYMRRRHGYGRHNDS